MADHSGVMALARISIVQLRSIGLLYSALVGRGILTPEEAGQLFREPMRFLEGQDMAPEIFRLYRESYETIARDLEGNPQQ